MKRIFAMLMAVMMAVTCLFAFASCGDKTDYEYIKDKGVLRVGVTDYEPMDYLDDNDQWTGFDAEMAKAFAASLGVTVKFVQITWSQKVLELNSKEIDCIWNGMTASDELGQKISLSASYAQNFQCAVVKSDSTIATVEAVKAAKVAVEAGSAGNTVASDTLNISEAKLAAVESQVAALNEVVAGTSDVAIIDYTMAQSVVGNGSYAGLKIVDTSAVCFEQEKFAVGFRAGSDMTAKLNAFFKQAYTDGTMETIRAKYPTVALDKESLGGIQ